MRLVSNLFHSKRGFQKKVRLAMTVNNKIEGLAPVFLYNRRWATLTATVIRRIEELPSIAIPLKSKKFAKRIVSPAVMKRPSVPPHSFLSKIGGNSPSLASI